MREAPLAPWYDNVSLSQIRETFKLVKDDKTVANLCIGDPSFSPPEVVTEALIRAVRDGFTHYENDAGLPALREAIVQDLSEREKATLDPYDHIVVTNGGINGIFSTFYSILEPGDEVILPEPIWIPFIQITRLLNCKTIFVPTRPEKNFVPSVEDIEKARSPRTKILVVVSPGNPTGCVYNPSSFSAIVDFCERNKLFLVHDQAYRDIVFEGVDQGSLVGHSRNVVGIRTLSKSHAMTGLRVGWVASLNNQLMDRVRAAVAFNNMCISTPNQYAALAALQSGWVWLHSKVQEYHLRMTMAADRLRRLGCVLDEPQGSFYLFPQHDRSPNLAIDLLNEARVAVVDGIHFGPSGRRHFRISCSVSWEVLTEGLTRIEQWFGNH